MVTTIHMDRADMSSHTSADTCRYEHSDASVKVTDLLERFSSQEQTIHPEEQTPEGCIG